MKTNNDFYPKMKVSLDGEVGIVLDDFNHWDSVYYVGGEKKQGIPSKNYGVIRWDTNKENDTEDWRGVFGSFIAAGGKELNQDYEFEFINDNGVLKTKGIE